MTLVRYNELFKNECSGSSIKTTILSGRVMSLIYKFVTKTAQQSKAYSRAYDWLLNDFIGRRAKNLILRTIPSDPWPGQAELGHEILKGIYPFSSSVIDEKSVWIWAPSKASQGWLDTMHSFEWLRALRVVGGDRARYRARNLIADWIDHHEKWDVKSWRTDIVARRLLAWLCFYGFYGASAHQDFQQRVLESCLKQGRHLERNYASDLHGFERLIGLKALFYLSVCLPECELDAAIVLHKFVETLGEQLSPDGLHISRNAALQIEVIRHTIDVRNLIGQSGLQPSKQGTILSEHISRMAASLRFLRQPDGQLPMMNGASLGWPVMIDTVLNHAVSRSKTTRNFDCGGYHRLALGRTDILIDAAQDDEKTNFTPLHYGLGGFEFMHNKTRIFTQCGGYVEEPKWHQALSATAAHNSFCLHGFDTLAGLDHMDLANIVVKREQSDILTAADANMLLEISHYGWKKYPTACHTRRLYLGQQGEDFRGEDRLHDAPPNLDFTLRFHLHPDVKASVIQNGYEILLNAGKNNGWRFMAGDYKLALEDSIYMGEPQKPRKTQQIIITGKTTLDTLSVRWALQKENS